MRIFWLLICLSFCGCSYRLTDLTLVSTKNFDSSNRYKNVGRFSGKSYSYWNRPSLKEAIDNMLEKGRGSFASNVVIDFYEDLLGTGYRVRGDVYREAGKR